MGYTDPPTINAGDKFLDSIWNKYVRDNLRALFQDTPQWLSISRTTSDFSKTSDTALEDISGLSFSIPASETWLFFASLFMTAPAAADYKFSVTAPSGATGIFGVTAATLSVSGAPYETTFGTAFNITAGGSGETGFFQGTVINSTTAGTVQLQAAQLTGNATPLTIFSGSWIMALRIA